MPLKSGRHGTQIQIWLRLKSGTFTTTQFFRELYPVYMKGFSSTNRHLLADPLAGIAQRTADLGQPQLGEPGRPTFVPRTSHLPVGRLRHFPLVRKSKQAPGSHVTEPSVRKWRVGRDQSMSRRMKTFSVKGHIVYILPSRFILLPPPRLSSVTVAWKQA